MNNKDLLTELKRKYESSWLFVQKPGSEDEHLMFCRELVVGQEEGVMELRSEVHGSMLLNVPSEMNVLFRYPKRGIFQHDNKVLLYTRYPARQWKRGICSGNSKIWAFTVTADRYPITITEKPLLSAFRQMTSSYKEAFSLLANPKMISVALENNYWITRYCTEKPVYLLCHDTQPIAVVTTTGKISKILVDAFSKDVEEISQGH